MNGNFVVYLIGYIIVIIGVAYGMSAAGLGNEWIIPAVLILIGLGIVYALSRSQRDKATERSTPGSQQTTQVQAPPQNQGSTTGQGHPSGGSSTQGGSTHGGSTQGGPS